MHTPPLSPESSTSTRKNSMITGTNKKVIYFCRHAEAIHNVREREAVQRAISLGQTDKEMQEMARKAVLQEDISLKDAPLSADGAEQARNSGRKLYELFRTGEGASPQSSMSGSSPRSRSKKASPFRRPDVVLVSPLRRALMTATELFLYAENGEDPPMFLAIEALREKRTGYVCDERCSVAELRAEFPHVDFSDIERGITAVPIGEDNEAVRARVAEYLDNRLEEVPGKYAAIVSHKGWLRELRMVLKSRVEAGLLRCNYDVAGDWEKTLYGNAEVRVAAFKWQDGDLVSVVSRSVDNAMLASAAMMGDGFEFALGPPSTGFSLFLAERTTKVHFISLAEGRHNVAVREAREERTGFEDPEHAEDFLLRKEGVSASQHPLHDARLTAKGAKQADKLRQLLANRPSGGRPFTAFDLVIVSPLTRACETAEIVFGKTPGTYGGEVIPPPRILVREECRERYGRYVCDGRRAVSELCEEFPDFDFSEMPSDEDVLHGDERETTIEVQERALRFLSWIRDRPERCVAVVTHSEFLKNLFGQFGDTLEEEDRDCLQRTGTNCELRSVVLCSHGAVQESEAPPSTVRVPSSGSLTSLLSY